MRRRDFITLLGGAAMAWPPAAHAQQSERLRRIGVLMGYARKRLGSTGPNRGVPGRTPEARVDGGPQHPDRHSLGDTRRCGLDATIRERTCRAAARSHSFEHYTDYNGALQQTRTIPIVFAMVADPVGSGFVASFPRPGGNVTGFSTTEDSLGGKWLELLKEIAPRVRRVAMLFNPAAATYAEYWLNPFKAAAVSFAVEAIAAPVRDKSDLETVVAALAREPHSGLTVMPDSFTDAHPREITSLAARYRLPAVYAYRFFTALGGLLSYGIDLTDNFPRAATYADRILKGEKPANLPVQAPTKYVLTINLKTAKALGLDVPMQLQQRADEVIE